MVLLHLRRTGRTDHVGNLFLIGIGHLGLAGQRVANTRSNPLDRHHVGIDASRVQLRAHRDADAVAGLSLCITRLRSACGGRRGGLLGRGGSRFARGGWLARST